MYTYMGYIFLHIYSVYISFYIYIGYIWMIVSMDINVVYIYAYMCKVKEALTDEKASAGGA